MADPKRWNVVYPIYINEAKTVKQGRKIAKEKAVDKPRLDEIVEVCKYLKLPFLEEVMNAATFPVVTAVDAVIGSTTNRTRVTSSKSAEFVST